MKFVTYALSVLAYRALALAGVLLAMIFAGGMLRSFLTCVDWIISLF